MASVTNKSKKNQRQPAAPIRRPSYRWVAVSVVAVAAVVAVALWFSQRAPEPPAISMTGLPPEVAQALDRALQKVRSTPRSGDAWGELGSLLLVYEFTSQAAIGLANAERFAPAEPRWPYLHGLLLKDSRRDAALAKFLVAADLCRDQPDMPRLRAAQLLLEFGRVEEAGQQFDRLLRLQPAHAAALLGTARVRLAQGQTAEVTNLLQRCVADPHTAKAAQALLSQALLQLGQAALADAAAHQAASLPPDQPWPDPYWTAARRLRADATARTDEASALLDRGRLEEAFALLTRITNSHPTADEAYYLLGWILNQQQRGPAAEAMLQEHLRLAPQSIKGQAQLAVSFLAQERFEEAVRLLERAIELKPAWAELHFNLAFASAQLGREEEAIRHFRETLRLSPQSVDACVALADLLLRRGDREEATRLLRQAVALKPDDQRAQFLLNRLGQDR